MILILVLGVIVLGWFLVAHGKDKPSDTRKALSRRNHDWYNYIAGFRKSAKSKEQKSIIDDILADIKKQGLVDSDVGITPEDDVQARPISQSSTQALETTVSLPAQNPKVKAAVIVSHRLVLTSSPQGLL